MVRQTSRMKVSGTPWWKRSLREQMKMRRGFRPWRGWGGRGGGGWALPAPRGGGGGGGGAAEQPGVGFHVTSVQGMGVVLGMGIVLDEVGVCVVVVDCDEAGVPVAGPVGPGGPAVERVGLECGEVGGPSAVVWAEDVADEVGDLKWVVLGGEPESLAGGADGVGAGEVGGPRGEGH